MAEITDNLRAIGATFRDAEQHQHADVLAEAVARLEAQEIAHNLADLNERASDNGTEWGHYIERHDRDEWTPLIYSSDDDREHAESCLRDGDLAPFRNARLVRRAVGPWTEVRDPDPDWSALRDACDEYSTAYMGEDDTGMPPALDKIRAALRGEDPYNPPEASRA